MLNWSRALSTILLILSAASAALAQVHHVERPDSMEVYFLADVDRLGERVRVLYQTMPSLQQQVADPDGWTVNVYVVEVHPDGRAKQQLLASAQRRYGALLLRRGHEEAFAIPAPGAPGSGQAQPLEVWSTRDGSVRSSIEVPVLPRVELGHSNIGPTDDGNLFVVNFNAHDSRRGGVGIVWHKLSPRGEILGGGEYDLGGAKVGYAGVFPARDGGIGLTVTSSVTREATRLETDIDNPVKRTLAGRSLEAEIHSETRMLVTDASGRRRWISPALERTFMWGAGFQIPEDLPVEEKLRLSTEQMRLLEEIGLEYGTRVVQHSPSASADADLVKSTPAGYAVLASKTVRRDRVPPAHGPYYLEIGKEGAVRREVYLGLLSEQIGAREFVDFLPIADGGFLLVGSHNPADTRDLHRHVTRVDSAGAPKSIVSLGPPDWKLERMAGTASNVWLIGQQWSHELNRTLLVLQKVNMSGAAPLEVVARPAPAAATPTPVAAMAAPVLAPPPSQPTGGCTCSCEEWAELQKMVESVQTMSDADKMKLVTDPDYLKTMTCASQCGVAYSQCGRN